MLYNLTIKYFNGRDYMAESLHNVEIIMKEMLDIQQKSKMFVELLSKGEALSQNQLILLLQLKINDGMKATEIAEFFSITPGAVTSMCDKLEKLELIQRIRENNDRRVVKMTLTSNGDKKVQEIFLKFSQDKLIDMANILREVNQLMNKIF
ncbi:MarR family transcriptional regulator [Lysinibacillus irui]|uniref:MarR family transcriptional regulator n=2 Tax=Lysinibacillus irui TaxID=2998077 RepID=A0AAJ5RLQ0_9BACI|nr:MarR family transcriptional regulator [Lysinibacillus irui]